MLPRNQIIALVAYIGTGAAAYFFTRDWQIVVAFQGAAAGFIISRMA